MKRYRILSLDGGGIRGLLALVLLERLEREVPGWLGKTNLLAGTSTGGIIALDGVMGIADYQCRQILGRNYHRLAPVFPPDKIIGLDAVDRIPDLVKFAEGVDISNAVKWLKAAWKQEEKTRPS